MLLCVTFVIFRGEEYIQHKYKAHFNLGMYEINT